MNTPGRFGFIWEVFWTRPVTGLKTSLQQSYHDMFLASWMIVSLAFMLFHFPSLSTWMLHKKRALKIIEDF